MLCQHEADSRKTSVNLILIRFLATTKRFLSHLIGVTFRPEVCFPNYGFLTRGLEKWKVVENESIRR